MGIVVTEVEGFGLNLLLELYAGVAGGMSLPAVPVSDVAMVPDEAVIDLNVNVVAS